MHEKSISLLTATIAVGIVGGQLAEAQPEQSHLQPGDIRQVMEEITVTARRVEESLQKVPIAISAMSSFEVPQCRICKLDRRIVD